MPLGDSITYGTGSTSCNGPGGCAGYRYPLHNILISGNIPFDFVGSQVSGPPNLPDRDHEGHPGWRIDQIANHVATWLIQYTPDVVILHIGTNDIVQNHDLANAGQRLGDLIDLMLTVSPDTYIFLAYIVPIPNSPADRDVLVRNYNASVHNIITQSQLSGRKVFGANMYPNFDQSAYSPDFADTVHPSDDGYGKMAEIWYGAFYFNGLPNL